MRQIEGYDIEYDFSSFKKIADLIYLDGPKELTLLELIENPNDGYLYSVDVDNDLNYHNIKLISTMSRLPVIRFPRIGTSARSISA